MARKIIPLYMLTLSLLFGNDPILIKLENGKELQGVFIGTYMDHVHVLVDEDLLYYACGDIRSIIDVRSILSEQKKEFDYDCGENTVTADILFPPGLDPMTGEWVTSLPDVFNPEISKPVERIKTDSHKSRLEKHGFSPDKIENIVDRAIIRVESENAVGASNIEPPSENEVSTFWIDNEEKTPESQKIINKQEIVEKDFIMINGVKYVRASLDEEINQDNLPRTAKKKTRKNNDDNNSLLYPREIRAMAIQDAKRHHDKVTWGLAGVAGCGTGFFGGMIGAEVGDFPGFVLGGTAGLALPFLIANNYDASNKLIYPRKIKTLQGMKLYKETYLKEAKKHALSSVRKGPYYAMIAGAAFFGFLILTLGI